MPEKQGGAGSARPARAWEPKASTLRGALLGCGHVSVFHLRAWQQIEGVTIVALANRTVEKAQARAREFGLPEEHVYRDYRDLLEAEDLDFVDVATDPAVHREQVEACARHGRHILCQKPLAPCLDDARAMIAAAEAAHVLLSVNENWRWRSWYRRLKRLVDEGAIGRPRYARIARHSDIALPGVPGQLPPLFASQPYTRELDRLIVYDWGIHLIDVLRFLFGRIDSMYARMSKASSLSQGEERAVLTLDVSGVIAVVDISWATVNGPAKHSPLEHVTIEGDDGTIKLSPDRGNLLRVRSRSGSLEERAFEGSAEDAYQASYTAAQRHFVECLRSGQVPETVAGDYLETLAATFAAYESAMLNQVVCL
jgi:predicted dehydrogenase